MVPIGLFVRGAAYRLWGLFELDVHLIGPLKKTDTMYLLGTDKLGRDLLSRLIHGTRVSMSIGLIGVAIRTAAAAKMNTRFMKIPSKRNPPRPAMPTRARDRGLRLFAPTIRQASEARRLSQPPRLCLCRRLEKKFHV